MNAMLRPALILAAFALTGTGLIALTHHFTREPIAAAERAERLRGLNALLPTALYDNDPIADAIEVRDPYHLGSPDPVTVYRAWQAGTPVAVGFTVIAPDGYSGPIRLLVVIRADGTLAGIRVLTHRETPGLGDPIEERKSPWGRQFAGRGLGDPPEERWKVRRDGGDFDQLAGATITPRAVVKAVKLALLYFEEHRAALFTPHTNLR